jgi:hypothetical protein
MFKVLFSILLVFWVVEITAQGTYFKKRMEYNQNDAALNNGIINLNEGGYLTFGSFNLFAGSDRYGAVLKLDSLGNPIDTFSINFPQTSIEIKNAFQLNNGYLLTGHLRKFSNNKFRPFFIRLTDNLDTLWTKTMNYSDSVSVFVSYSIMCNDSNLATTGIYTDTTGYQQILLLKTDTLGNEIFFKSYGYANEHQFNYWNMDQALDGGFILAGASTFFHPLGSGYEKHIAIKTDSLGNQHWVYPFGRNDNDNGGCRVKAMSDSTVMVFTATPTSSSPTPNYRWNFRKLRYNMSTELYFEQGPDDPQIGMGDMVELSDTSFVLCLSKYNRLFLTKFDKYGTQLWSRLNKPSVSQFTGTALNLVPSDSGFVYSGFIQPQLSLGDTGTQDIFVIKTNCIGWADPPFADATTGSLDNFEVVLDNNSMYFGNCFINWGDGNFDTLYESSDTLIYHTYSNDGIFNATIIAEACGDNDTLNLNVVSSLVGDFRT